MIQHKPSSTKDPGTANTQREYSSRSHSTKSQRVRAINERKERRQRGRARHRCGVSKPSLQQQARQRQVEGPMGAWALLLHCQSLPTGDDIMRTGANEQETIHEIMGLRGVNAYYRVIATALNDSGHRPKRAKRWSPMTVKRIYDRETKRASPPLKDTLVATLMDDQMLIPHSGQPAGPAGGGPRVPRSNPLAQAEYVVGDEVVN